MGQTITAYGDWQIDNFFPPNFSDFKVIGTPSSSRIEFNVEGLPAGIAINVILSGEFSNTASLASMKDLSGSDLIARTQVFINQGLALDGLLNPSVAVSQTLITGSSAEFSGSDIFVGSTAQQGSGDLMVGFEGNDTFYPNADPGDPSDVTGYDYVHGGSGSDRVIYRGLRSEYSIATDQLPDGNSTVKGFRITDSVAGRDGSDGLVEIERIQFKDDAVAFDISGISGKAYRIYKAAFDRNPDATGLGYWIAQMDKGMDVVEVAARFIDSQEFRELYGSNASSASFLTKVYNNVLDRNPDQLGLDWWVNEMQTNPSKTWQKVLADFSESTENQANVAALIANGIVYDAWE
jgi:hypothetical protein